MIDRTGDILRCPEDPMKYSSNIHTYCAVRVHAAFCQDIKPKALFLCCSFKDSTHACHRSITCPCDVRPEPLVALAMFSAVYARAHMPVRGYCRSHTSTETNEGGSHCLSRTWGADASRSLPLGPTKSLKKLNLILRAAMYPEFGPKCYLGKVLYLGWCYVLVPRLQLLGVGRASAARLGARGSANSLGTHPLKILQVSAAFISSHIKINDSYPEATTVARGQRRRPVV